MKIIITMAGAGSRFKDVGIDKPKHEIIARGKTLFEWSMLSLSEFFNKAEFIFVVRKGNWDEVTLADTCRKLGIKVFQTIVISELTNGQATTVLQARKAFTSDEDFLVYNIDTAVTPGLIKPEQIPSDKEGHIICFRAEGDHWSFVLPNSENPNLVCKVSEKKRISDLATIGLYYFNSFTMYEELVHTFGSRVKAEYGEIYIAPLYQHLCKDWRMQVSWCEVPVESVCCLGKPEEVIAFDPEYMKYNQ